MSGKTAATLFWYPRRSDHLRHARSPDFSKNDPSGRKDAGHRHLRPLANRPRLHQRIRGLLFEKAEIATFNIQGSVTLLLAESVEELTSRRRRRGLHWPRRSTPSPIYTRDSRCRGTIGYATSKTPGPPELCPKPRADRSGATIIRNRSHQNRAKSTFPTSFRRRQALLRNCTRCAGSRSRRSAATVQRSSHHTVSGVAIRSLRCNNKKPRKADFSVKNILKSSCLLSMRGRFENALCSRIRVMRIHRNSRRGRRTRSHDIRPAGKSPLRFPPPAAKYCSTSPDTGSRRVLRPNTSWW